MSENPRYFAETPENIAALAAGLQPPPEPEPSPREAFAALLVGLDARPPFDLSALFPTTPEETTT